MARTRAQLPPLDEHSDEDTLVPTAAPSDAAWRSWFDELPGGKMSEDEAMALAREAVDEVRASR